jgi:glycosyltransferase involved in cell wall biosynthesis
MIMTAPRLIALNASTAPGYDASSIAARVSRPKIVFIDYFPPHYRRGLYEEISRHAEAEFCFFSDQHERWSDPNVPAVWEGNYRRVEFPRRRILGQSVVPGILRRILAGRYEAVIKLPNGRLMFPLSYWAARLSGTGFVLWTEMWMHPRTSFHRLSKPLMESVYRHADAIVVSGQHVRRFVLETPGVEPEKIFVARLAVDATPFQSIERTPGGGSPEILYVGQFEERKGLPYLLDAFDRLSGTGARLRMIGGGVQQDWVHSRVNGREDIELVGYRSQGELPGEFARARCLVLPSVTTREDREPWGLVVNEAMHAGVPVVVSDTVGAAAAGLVRHGRNGLIVPERDSGALADALRRLVADPELAARMGDAARTDAAEFDYQGMAGAFLDAAEYAIKARRGPADPVSGS